MEKFLGEHPSEPEQFHSEPLKSPYYTPKVRKDFMNHASSSGALSNPYPIFLPTKMYKEEDIISEEDEKSALTTSLPELRKSKKSKNPISVFKGNRSEDKLPKKSNSERKYEVSLVSTEIESDKETTAL